MSKKTTITLTITLAVSFGAYRHCLWDTCCKNIIKDPDQKGRFQLLEGKKCESGTLYFCERYLEARIVMETEQGIGLYSDEMWGGFVVASKKPFKRGSTDE